MKKVAALFFAFLLLFFVACSSEGEEASVDPVPAEEVLEAEEEISLYKDPFEITGELYIETRTAIEAPEVKRAEESGRSLLNQYSQNLGSDIIAADYYTGKWALARPGREEEGDYIELIEGTEKAILYQCGSIYPYIASVCYNVNGVQWIEYNETHWRMRQILTDGQAVRLLRESQTSAKGVSVAVSWEDSLMILYDTADGAALLRAWNNEKSRWREELESVRTIQKEAPQSVGDWATWIELTSKGWAAVSRNFITEEKSIFILPDGNKPTAATFDGQLLIFLIDGYLYVYDMEQDQTSLISGGVSDYQHVPQSGAVLSLTNNRYAAMRFELGKIDAEGNSAANILYPLARIQEGGEIRKVFFYEGDVDVANFLVERNGAYEQLTITMRHPQ